MDKPSLSVSNVMDAITGYEDQFLSYVLNRNTTASECERLGTEPHFNVSEPPNFYCREIVQQMAKTDPLHFTQLAILFLEKCMRAGCFDAPDQELVEE